MQECKMSSSRAVFHKRGTQQTQTRDFVVFCCQVRVISISHGSIPDVFLRVPDMCLMLFLSARWSVCVCIRSVCIAEGAFLFDMFQRDCIMMT